MHFIVKMHEHYKQRTTQNKFVFSTFLPRRSNSIFETKI